MNPITIIRNLATIVRNEGVTAAAQCAVDRAIVRFQEWRFGMDTEQVIFLRDLGLDETGRGEYCPTDFNDFHTLMACVEIRSGKDVFSDYGAGLGRSVVLAATYPFARVIGVELSEQLGVRAQKNVEKARPKLRCQNVEISISDATEYELPADVSVIYFNNPFFGVILDRVLEKIQSSLGKNPRKITVICNMPQDSEFRRRIQRQTWLEQTHEVPLRHGRQGLILVSKND